MVRTGIPGVGTTPPRRRNTGLREGVMMDRFVATTHQGVNGFDFGRRFEGSVPVQARDHRKRHRKPISAKANSQRDYALAA